MLGGRSYRRCNTRYKKRVFLFSVMMCGSVCVTVYTILFGCCSVVTEIDSAAVVYVDTYSHHPYRIISGGTSFKRGNKNIHLESPDEQSLARHNRNLQNSVLDENQDLKRHNLDMKTIKHPSRLSSKSLTVSSSDLKRKVTTQNGWEEIYLEEGEKDSESDDGGEEYEADGNHSPKGHAASTLQRIEQNATKKLPQAIVIGVKKGGTRALLEFLRLHPDIRAPGPEPHYFDKYYEKGFEWYRKQMPPTIEGQVTIEKTPSYFVTKEVPRRIFNMSRSVKLLVVVRDPVTRAISDYTQSKSKRPEMKPFEEMSFLDNTTGLVDTSWGAIRIGVYAKHLERWLQYFPLKQMHFVSGERLIKDPAGELDKVQEFLGLKKVISDKHFYFNGTRGFPCLKKPERSGRPHCLGKTKGRKHPDVDPKVIHRLRDFYRPFNSKFYQIVGHDFGWS